MQPVVYILNLNDGGLSDIKQVSLIRTSCSDWRTRFPNAEIHTLIGEQKLTKGEKVIDNVIGIFTDAPFGIPVLINSVKNMDKQFYLVEKDGKRFFVTVTDEFIETRQLAK